MKKKSAGQILLFFSNQLLFFEVYIVSFARRLHTAAVTTTYLVFSQNRPPVAPSWNSFCFNITAQCFAHICQNLIQALLNFMVLHGTVNLKQSLNFADLDDSLRDEHLGVSFFGELEVEIAIHTLIVI